MKQSILKQQAMKGPFYRSTGKKKSPLMFSLNLTTLIDAFCILVIFLLSNMTKQDAQMNLKSQISLPFATQSEALKIGTVVEVSAQGYMIKNKFISSNDLTKELLLIKQETHTDELIVQADRGLDFSKISILVRAAGHAGFSKFMFAVIPETRQAKL